MKDDVAMSLSQMSPSPVLLIGGSGVVGRWAARFLREAYPDLPLLIGGRDRAKADQVAADIGHAEGVTLDLTAGDLGIGERQVSAVGVFLKDDQVAGLRFAQARGVPHICISSVLHEIGPEVAHYMHKPHAAAVVLGAEWLIGATTIPALSFAKAFSHIESIAIGALLDDEDIGGPAQIEDLERSTKIPPPALTRRDGAYVWRAGDDTTSTFRAADGTEMASSALSPCDVAALATATGAPNVRFDVATGVTSSRRRGEPMSTEIIIELAGMDHAGQPLRTRHAVIHPQGQMPLTGLGAALVLARLIGLDGQAPVPPGLYFPYQLLDPDAYLASFRRAGGIILELE